MILENTPKNCKTVLSSSSRLSLLPKGYNNNVTTASTAQHEALLGIQEALPHEGGDAQVPVNTGPFYMRLEHPWILAQFPHGHQGMAELQTLVTPAPPLAWLGWTCWKLSPRPPGWRLQFLSLSQHIPQQQQ